MSNNNNNMSNNNNKIDKNKIIVGLVNVILSKLHPGTNNNKINNINNNNQLL